MDNRTIGQLFGWQDNRGLCGRELATWTIQDQQNAELQQASQKLMSEPVRQQKAEVDIAEAVATQYLKQQELHTQEQIARDKRIMANVRANHKRPNTCNNVTLCMQVFGVQYNGAVAMCERMGLEPKKVGE